MMTERSETTTAGDFFIVDNSEDHWTALEYLRQWCEISSAVDIATGYFEIGALLALDGAWQKIDRIRILIGSETSRQTVEAVRAARKRLDGSLDEERQHDPFLEGLAAIVDAIRTGKIEVRVYRRRKFHAKAYITHGRLDVVGSAALVGSSNFTKPGLTRNVELNVRFTGVEVRELQAWFQDHWDEGEDISAEMLEVTERHGRSYSPFEIYARSLQVLTENVEPSATEWEQNHSTIYPMLAPYQKEAYHGLKQRAAQWNGAFLTDGVGLGKTFVGLMLAEYYAVKQHKNVLILATKTGQDAVWEPELERHLPELQGVFTNVKVMAHTDLSTRDAERKVRDLASRVDVVIVDEAHNFRNHGRKGDDPEVNRSRWWRLQEICEGKTVFLLTATPINNTLFDFVHELELFSGLDDTYFGALGIPSLRSYVTHLERTFLESQSEDGGGSLELTDFDQLMGQDKLLEALIVQNTRQYAQRSAEAAEEGAVLFPTPDLPRAVPYSYNLAYSALLSELERAFAKSDPLFVLPMYYPLAYSLEPDVNTIEENRQKQVVGLIRTTFLKRFESSIASFAGSCADLASKIAQWIADNSTSMPEHAERVATWSTDTRHLFEQVHTMFRPGLEAGDILFAEDDEEEVLEEGSDAVLDPAEYDLAAMFDVAFDDLAQLTSLLERAIDVGRLNDDKYSQLLAMLAGGKRAKGKDPTVFDPAFSTQKVLVFTEFADTARYLHDRLRSDGITDIDRLDGSRKGSRLEMIQRFAPHYNRVSAADRSKLAPLRVLVSTDVLAEGVNLQDATLIINYDIHWNPVRLMQRIGRVDRRLDDGCEKAIVAEDPSTKPHRRRIQVRNFLPPDELDRIITLYQRVQSRARLISKTLGIPGGRLFDATDMLDDVKVFQAFMSEYEGEISPTESLRLHYLDLCNRFPDLDDRLAEMPAAVHSARTGEPQGTFMCTVEPIRSSGEDEVEASWTLEGGRPRWAFRYPDGSITTDVAVIDGAIRCEPDEPKEDVADRAGARKVLREWQDERHQQLMKEARLPLDAPAPSPVCWMEVR